ncbi:MAG TPA: DNA polymerase III subunit delta' [Actinomycetaceae bacterium]|nr:DNA polymerase III subunit delta' [Actinomycetaceae bacterium]
MSVWDEVVGQPSAVATLAAAARAARDIAEGGDATAGAMTHAWLITGPPGSGRSVAARAFAAALQCEDDAEVGCGRCRGCRTVRAGTHADVDVIATERVNFRIEDMRPVVSAAQQAPSQGRWRVMLMEDADRMVERTSNVLLKAIEEPPARTVWLLCAPSAQDLIATIRSRCRHVSLRVPPARDVAELLAARDGIAPGIALTAARATQGHIGMARRLATDDDTRRRRQAILEVPTRIRGVADAVVAAGELVELAQEEAKEATAQRDAAERAELLRGLGAEGLTRLPPALRAQVRRLEDDQKSRATRAQRDVLDRAMVDLLALYRDVIVTQLGADVDVINADMTEAIAALAAASTPEQTLRRMDAVATARTRLAANVAPLLAVEAMMVALRPQG